MRRIIRAFDAFLRRQTGVFEFSDDPRGILRGQFSSAPDDLTVGGCRIAAGDPVFQLHLWNEHIPAIPPNGPDLAWAARVYVPLIPSFRNLARRMITDPAYAGIRALCGETILATDDAGSITKLFLRLGFFDFPYHNPLGRFGEFWENFYTWWIMWAFNQASLRGRRLLKMRRSRLWMSRGDFLRRYG